MGMIREMSNEREQDDKKMDWCGTGREAGRAKTMRVNGGDFRRAQGRNTAGESRHLFITLGLLYPYLLVIPDVKHGRPHFVIIADLTNNPDSRVVSGGWCAPALLYIIRLSLSIRRRLALVDGR